MPRGTRTTSSTQTSATEVEPNLENRHCAIVRRAMIRLTIYSAALFLMQFTCTRLMKSSRKKSVPRAESSHKQQRRRRYKPLTQASHRQRCRKRHGSLASSHVRDVLLASEAPYAEFCTKETVQRLTQTFWQTYSRLTSIINEYDKERLTSVT